MAMTTYVVSRHAGAVEWVTKRIPGACAVEHLDVDRVESGDRVIGTLPLHLVARLCGKGATFEHLQVDVPPERRGDELSGADLDALGAQLVPYTVRVAQPDRPSPREQRRPAVRPLWRRVATFLTGFGLVSVIVTLQAFMVEAFLDAYEQSRSAAWVRVGDGLLFFGLSAAVAWLIFKARHKLISSTIHRLGRVPPKRALIMGVSRPSTAIADELEQAAHLPLHVLTLDSDAYRADMAKRSPDAGVRNFAWQQNLRAIAPHLDVLETVLVIPSEGSSDVPDAFCDFVRTKCCEAGHHIEVKIAEGDHPDYEDYEKTRLAFQEAVADARKRFPEDEIAIDVTAGQKIFSIAASIATVNQNMVFTYVNNKGRVAAYNASMQLGDLY